MTTERKLTILVLEYLGLVVAALTVPKVAAQGQQGLAAAGTAAFWFLIIAFFACILSVFALVTALRAWKGLAVRYRIIGIAPGIFSLLAILSLILFLRYETSKESDPMPGTVTKPVAEVSSVGNP